MIGLLKQARRETGSAENKAMMERLEGVGWFPEMDTVRNSVKEVRE